MTEKVLRRTERNNKNRGKKIALVAILTIIVLLLSAAFYIWGQLNRSYHPLPNLGVGEAKSEKKDLLEEPVTFLILGVDARKDDKGRSDTIIFSVLNPKDKSITLISLPRDTYTEIAGKNYKDKINHAMNYGLETSVATIEKFFKTKVDYYAVIDFAAFQKIIDTIGGVEINVEKRMKYSDPTQDLYIDLYPGLQRLNGEQAMWYARFRHDALGDFGRIERQQEIIKAILDQSLNIRSATKILDFAKIAGDHLRTNLTTADMLKIFNTYKEATSTNLHTEKVEASTFELNGISYVKVSEEEVARLRQIVQDRLNNVPIVTPENTANTPNSTSTNK